MLEGRFQERAFGVGAVESSQGAEVGPFGEGGGGHDEFRGGGQSGGEHERRGVRDPAGVLDGVGEDDQLGLWCLLEFVQQQDQARVVFGPGDTVASEIRPASICRWPAACGDLVAFKGLEQ